MRSSAMRSNERPLYVRSIVFFFQAEDGIRDVAVTGVQTCALPICYGTFILAMDRSLGFGSTPSDWTPYSDSISLRLPYSVNRSEERRVGKECRSRWSPYH